MSLASLCPYSSEMRPWHSSCQEMESISLLNPGWPCDLLWPTECSRSDIPWLLSSSLVASTLTLGPLRPLCSEETRSTEAYGNMRGSCKTTSTNCQASEWGCFGPSWAVSDDCSHTNKWLKTFFWGTSLAAQWLRLFFHCQSLMRELRSQMPCTAAKIKK